MILNGMLFGLGMMAFGSFMIAGQYLAYKNLTTWMPFMILTGVGFILAGLYLFVSFIFDSEKEEQTNLVIQ